MTETSFHQESDTQIFFLSALGSILLHGLLVASLANMPQTTIEKDELPTVQVNLIASSEISEKPASETPTPIQPHVAMPDVPPPPMPLTRTQRSQPSVAPLQASLTPTAKQALTPPAPAKRILQDTRASQALQSRKMMKMRIPIPTQQATPTLPTKTTQTNILSHVAPPLPTIRKERFAARALPAPATVTTPRTLTATLPDQTGSTMTRPTIISSSRPAYPRVARESGWEGTVVVRTLVDTNGRPSQVKLRKSCGHPTLDEAAQDAVQHWIFQPAKDGNIPITKWVDIPIKFALNS